MHQINNKVNLVSLFQRDEVLLSPEDYFFGAASVEAVFVSVVVVVVLLASVTFVPDAFEQQDALAEDDFEHASAEALEHDSFEAALVALAPSHARAGAIAMPKHKTAAAKNLTAFIDNSFIIKVKHLTATH